MKRPQFQMPIQLPVDLPDWMRTMPWLSLGVAIVWLVTALVVELGFSSRLEVASETHRAAASLATREPIIEVSNRHMRVVRAVKPEFENDTVLEFMRKKPASSHDVALQHEFEALAEDALLMLARHPYRSLGVVPNDVLPHTHLTYAFVHSGVVHMLATVLLLLLAAPLLEGLWGWRALAPVMLLTSTIGALAYGLAHGASGRALVGGTALVTGLVAAVITRFRDDEVDLLAWLSPVADLELRAPAWTLAIAWAAYEFVCWISIPSGLPTGTDNALGLTAQLSSAVVGVGAAFAIERFGWESGRDARRITEHAVAASQKKQAAARRFDLTRIKQMCEQGEQDDAFFLLQTEVDENVRNRDVVKFYWDMAQERGVIDEAAPVLVRLLEEELRRGAHKTAAGLWRTLRDKAPNHPLSSPTLVRLAPALGKLEGKESAVAALQQALEPHNDGLTPALACQIARWSLELDTELAGAAARCALESDELDAKDRNELEMIATVVAPPAVEVEQEDDDKTPPPSVFFLESDRSAFGDVDDLSAFSAQSFPDGAITEALPMAIEGGDLTVEIPGKGPTTIANARLRAVATVGVKGLGPKPVVLLDLVLDGSGTELPLSVLRLNCSASDPRTLVPGAANASEALRTIVASLRTRSEVQLLVDVTDKSRQRDAIFDSLEAYHEGILKPAGTALA